MAYQIYKILGFCVGLTLVPIFWLHPRGRVKLSERLGLWPKISGDVVWLHAASVGEVNGLLPLIAHLRQIFSDVPILLTTVSATGLERAGSAVDHACLLPFDNPVFLRSVLRAVKPRCFIFGETELWPCLLTALESANVPIIMVNATISDFSWKAYKLLRVLFPHLLDKVDYFLVANKKTYQRLEGLGVTKQRMQLVGNLKYCQQGTSTVDQKPTKTKSEYFSRPLPIVVLGSLRPGEEHWWFPILSEFRQQLNIVVAPRHPERSEYFVAALKKNGFEVQLESTGGWPVGSKALVVDSLGKLTQFYKIADLAFVGGSLIPGVGGHNPLEPAAFSVPVCMGSYYQNVEELVAEMVEQRAIEIIASEKDIKSLLERVLTKDDELKVLGDNARRYFMSRQDVLTAAIKLIDQVCVKS